MPKFVVKKCDMNGCRFWRFGDTCVKDGMKMPTKLIDHLSFMDSTACQVSQQIKEFRLNKLLDGEQ